MKIGRLFLLGLVSAILQVLLFRSLMTVLYGNEMVIVGLLTAWLLGIALGCFLWRRSQGSGVLLFLGLLAGAATWWSVFQVRLWLGIPPGQLVDVFLSLGVSLGLLMPLCIILGAAFSALVHEAGAGQEGRCYAYESWGYVAGGVCVVLFLLSPWRQLGWQQRVVQWPGYTVKSVVETPRASFAIVERQGSMSLIENGLQSGTTDDLATAEEHVHYALLAHAAPQRVLLLGGLAEGALGEALKTSDAHVDIIEPDADMILAVQAYFPGRAQSLAHSRARLILGDMRQEVRSCQQSYDVIILLAGEPLSLLTGRSYTREFFADVRHCLAPGGVFALTRLASENYVNPEGRISLSGARATLQAVFPAVRVIPGHQYIFLSSLTPEAVNLDPGVLTARFKERGLETVFVRAEFFEDRLDARRMRDVKAWLDAGGAVHQDMRPLGVSEALAYWSTRTDSIFPRALAVFRQCGWVLWCVPFLVLLCSFRNVNRRKTSLAVAGFNQILLQSGVMILFQAVIGNIYTLLGVLSAGFMLGIGAGAWLGRKFSLVKAQEFALLLLLSAGVLSYVVALHALLSFLFFFIVPLAAGVCGGWQYASATREGVPGAQAYGIDVLGAAAGALLGGLFLIPLWGIPGALLYGAILQFAVYYPARSSARL